MLFYLSSYLYNYPYFFFFFFNDTATTEIYTLSLHDALPISNYSLNCAAGGRRLAGHIRLKPWLQDRKSTRLNSSHGYISYAVFCLKKKKKTYSNRRRPNHNKAAMIWTLGKLSWAQWRA